MEQLLDWSYLVAFLLGFLFLTSLGWFLNKENQYQTDRQKKGTGFKSTMVLSAGTQFNSVVKERLESEVGDYEPPWWYSPHIGTLIPFGKHLNLQFQTDMFENDDGAFTLDWYPTKPPVSDEQVNIIVFLPGLGLTSQNVRIFLESKFHQNQKFAQNFANLVCSTGYYIAIVGPRGVNIPLKSTKFWHPSLHEDTLCVLEYINGLYHEHANLFLVGYSAGSNIVQRAVRVYTKKHHAHKKPHTAQNNDGASSTNVVYRTRFQLRQEKQTNPAFSMMAARDLPCSEVLGVLCVCINYDYLSARNALERTLMGKVYSLFMAHAMKEIVTRNAHVHDQLPGGRLKVSQLLSLCMFVSDYDRHFGAYLHGYETEESMCGDLSMFAHEEVDVPFLAIQPSDDPLHMGQVRENIRLDHLLANPHFIYMEPQHGNHFGFYEGSLLDAMSNDTSYTYPAKVAISFFNTILEHRHK